MNLLKIFGILIPKGISLHIELFGAVDELGPSHCPYGDKRTRYSLLKKFIVQDEDPKASEGKSSKARAKLRKVEGSPSGE